MRSHGTFNLRFFATAKPGSPYLIKQKQAVLHLKLDPNTHGNRLSPFSMGIRASGTGSKNLSKLGNTYVHHINRQLFI
ncbi:MAG: hypothetical protein AB8G05_15775 [Oligoflexales bacterium]